MHEGCGGDCVDAVRRKRADSSRYSAGRNITRIEKASVTSRLDRSQPAHTYTMEEATNRTRNTQPPEWDLCRHLGAYCHEVEPLFREVDNFADRGYGERDIHLILGLQVLT